jgi:hypothetical protein
VTQIALLILGWLFGLLTGPIAEHIRRRRARGSLANALDYELADLLDQCVMIVHFVDVRRGTLTRPRVEWALDRLKNTRSENARGVANRLQEILASSDAEIAALAAQVEQPDNNISFRSLQIPFLASQLHQLDVFSVATQGRLLRLTTDVRMYNEIAAEAMKSSDRTFDSSIEGDNRTRLMGNIRRAEQRAQQRAEIIADSIVRVGPIQ